MLRLCSLVILLIILAAMLPIHIGAEVASVSLVDMNSQARFVGVVHEESVSQLSEIFQFLSDRFPRFPLFWGKTAYANVKEVWKGSAYKQISYRASPSWVCDVSKAVAGTDAVVFLDKAQLYGLEIAWAGGGRYQLFREGSKSYIEFHADRLPLELASKAIAVSEYKNHLALDDLRAWCLAHNK